MLEKINRFKDPFSNQAKNQPIQKLELKRFKEELESALPNSESEAGPSTASLSNQVGGSLAGKLGLNV